MRPEVEVKITGSWRTYLYATGLLCITPEFTLFVCIYPVT